MSDWRIRVGDCVEQMRELDAESVQTCITSPPYWGLRDYGVDGQLGLEDTPEAYVARMVEVFREVRRVLREDGTLWLNLGDSYNGSGKGRWEKNDVQKEVYVPPPETPISSAPGLKPKDLVGIPWRVAFALQADGWYLRSDIIWAKPNPMPESVTDRPTKAHEYVFLLSKFPRYFYDAEAIKDDALRAGETGDFGGAKGRELDVPEGDPSYRGGADQWGRSHTTGSKRNKRTVWTVPTRPFPGAHFAVFPPDLIEPCVLAGSSPKACGECGAPWVRVVEKGESDWARIKRETGKDWRDLQAEGESRGVALKGGAPSVGGTRNENGTVPSLRGASSHTTGWAPSCDHDDSGRSVVLDPFTGSGTTGLVALKHGRRFVGIELSPEYAEMARRRLDTFDADGYSAAVKDQRPDAPGQRRLFQ